MAGEAQVSSQMHYMLTLSYPSPKHIIAMKVNWGVPAYRNITTEGTVGGRLSTRQLVIKLHFTLKCVFSNQ